MDEEEAGAPQEANLETPGKVTRERPVCVAALCLVGDFSNARGGQVPSKVPAPATGIHLVIGLSYVSVCDLACLLPLGAARQLRVIAHRSVCVNAPQSTRDSLQLAPESGYKMAQHYKMAAGNDIRTNFQLLKIHARQTLLVAVCSFYAFPPEKPPATANLKKEEGRKRERKKEREKERENEKEDSISLMISTQTHFQTSS
ncbi:uncharacterized protein LOC128327428 [Hemicordylus capensis]|uniref:uncharacterized protein LOC128327428 n=1 Tax=Hemicordylus capensis TaxID=884348 RepID=UPI00230411CD|nr:uncharacterized protein LOC128327428 [Hemicordylus capensis]